MYEWRQKYHFTIPLKAQGCKNGFRCKSVIVFKDPKKTNYTEMSVFLRSDPYEIKNYYQYVSYQYSYHINRVASAHLQLCGRASSSVADHSRAQAVDASGRVITIKHKIDSTEINLIRETPGEKIFTSFIRYLLHFIYTKAQFQIFFSLLNNYTYFSIHQDKWP